MSKQQLLKAENIKVKFGEQTVLDFEQFYVYEGEKVGLIGSNGSGKTTLLKVLSGELESETGRVKLMCEPLFFHQFAENVDCYQLDGKEIKALGVKDKLWQEHVSGGENTRLRLAQVFSSDRPLVFLDEPTANLDIKGVELLYKKLETIPTMVLVSHDRDLLDRVCTRIVEIENGKLRSYSSNYESYQSQKQLEYDSKWSEYENYTAEKKRLQRAAQGKKDKARSIDRKPKNISSKDMKDISIGSSRKPEDKARTLEKGAVNIMKRIEHMEVKEKPRDLPKIRPDFRLTNPPENRIVISGEHISFSYEDNPIFIDSAFQIENGSKTVITGDNGTGKTTLLHMIENRNQIKLAFARLFVSDANILVLDEPTNYLDIQSVEALEQQFKEYEGTIVFVSHDKAFIYAVADQTLEIKNKNILIPY